MSRRERSQWTAGPVRTNEARNAGGGKRERNVGDRRLTPAPGPACVPHRARAMRGLDPFGRWSLSRSSHVVRNPPLEFAADATAGSYSARECEDCGIRDRTRESGERVVQAVRPVHL